MCAQLAQLVELKGGCEEKKAISVQLVQLYGGYMK
jgi:hypothetical protein